MERMLEPEVEPRGWSSLNEFLISIPNEDAREILKITQGKDPVSPDHMSFTVDLREVQQAMARARHKVWKEVIVWGAIVVLVAATVATVFMMR